MKKILSKIIRIFCGVSAVATGILGFAGIYEQANLPDKIYLAEGNEIAINSHFPIKPMGLALELPTEIYSKAGNTFNLSLVTLGNSAVKDVNVEIVERKMLVPSGQPFGIKMFTDGVVVVGMSNIYTEKGVVNPAKNAGLKVGDVITSINGEKILLNEQVEKIIKNNKGEAVQIEFLRGDNKMSLNVTPALSEEDNCYKIGIWVRDSSAGIGTLTYIDPQDMTFGGLGHAVCDIDTEQIMPLHSGEIADVMITGVKKGFSGDPGELKGIFMNQNNVGKVEKNCETGVYGSLNTKKEAGFPIPVAFQDEIHTGKAKILATLSGTTPEEYEILIEKVGGGNNHTKNMIIRVTDPRLLEKAGGIVQGMSGSPIIQDDMLVGAVTHVFVNDPTRGYGIFIENMINSAEEMDQNKTAA